MAYEFYNIQLANTPPTPSSEIEADLQSSINDLFEIASNISIIEMETSTPSVFVNITVRLEDTYKIKEQSNIKDDYQHIIFKNFSIKPSLGDYFRFKGFYWMVIDTGNLATSTNSVMVRRCGDFLRFFDDSGIYHKIPCIVERSIMYDLDKNMYIALPDNQVRVLVKYNIETKKIKYADMLDNNIKYTRFIFEEYAYRTVSIDRHTYLRLGIGYIDLRCQSDQINLYDDLVRNIADTNKEVISSTPTNGYDIQFLPILSSIKLSEMKITNVVFTNNGIPYSDTPIWQIRETDGISVSNLAIIVSSNNSSCTIKSSEIPTNIGRIFRLYCVGLNKTSYLEITIKSLFSGGA